MENSKFIALYNCLDSQELEGLHKWIKSPLHNSNPDLIKLFNYISSRRKITATSVQKQRVYKHLYPNEKYNDLQLRKLMSQGKIALENFVKFWMSKKDEFLQQKYLIDYLLDHKQHKLAQQHLTKAKLSQNKSNVQNHKYYYQQYQLEEENFEQIGTQTRIRSTNLQAIFDNLSIAFIIENLRYACIAITHQNLYKTSYQVPFLEAILTQIKQPPYTNIQAIQLYYYAYMSLSKPETTTYFESLKDRLLKYGTILTATETRSLYMIAINYCIKRINTDETQQYIRQVFELYQQGLKDKILLDNGILSRFTYKNIATAALHIQEFEWTENYIQDYVAYLEPSYQENYLHYNTAKLHFAKAEYNQALQLLTQVEYDDLFLNIDAKMMLLKIYYEQGSFDALDSLLHSFNTFLQRKLVMSYHKTNYSNIIRLSRKLFELPSHNKTAKQELIELINNTHPLTERQWLLEQLAKK